MDNQEFNPNEMARPNGNYFGYPYTCQEADIVLVSIPWDVTTSYRPGSSKGPEAIKDASVQLDFFDFDVPGAWKIKVATCPINPKLVEKNKKFRKKAEKIICHLGKGGKLIDKEIKDDLNFVNQGSEWLNIYVNELAKHWFGHGKKVGLIGGDHSIPLGYIRALGEKYPGFGILHIDAHADLRKAYEGFTYSHASIMYNAMQVPGVSNLVQVAVRDVCQQEMDLAASDPRITLFHDFHLKQQAFKGITWQKQCDEIISKLPQNVYISFDIDGLDPSLCPNTGTPVPGGLSYHEAVYLIKSVASAGKTIIGFDLCEVAPGKDEWDANVGARILFKLVNYL